METKKKQKSSNTPLKSYARYSAVGFQMLFIVLAGVFGGMQLDKLVHWPFPVFTIVLSLLAVFGAIYYVIKDLLK
jgi:ATP synthase protein I